MASKTYLITGANRGLGRALVEALLLRPNTTIIACVRDPTSPTSLTLSSLQTKSPNSKLIILPLDNSSETSIHAAIATLQSIHSITTIDTIIANAGISNHHGPTLSTPLSKIHQSFTINTIAVLALFQATYPLLKNSKHPIFVAMSSEVASIGGMGDVPIEAVGYGMSKAALNYLIRKIHFENEELVAFVINPGWVRTDMGNEGAVMNGLVEAPVGVEESVRGMLDKLDSATRENISGTFQSYDDEKLPW